MKKYLILLATLVAAVACNGRMEPDEELLEEVKALTDYAPYGDPTLAVGDNLGAETLDPIIDNTVSIPVNFVGIDWTAAGKKVLDAAIDKLASYGGTIGSTIAGILSPILSEELFGPEPKSEEVVLLNTVLDNIHQMDSKLDLIIQNTEKIYKRLDELELNTLLDKFIATRHHLESVRDLNDFTYAMLYSTSDPKEQYDIIDEWAKTLVNGNSAYLEVNNILREIMDYSYTYNGVNVNFCAAIDLFVFSGVVWESSGYNYREAFRAQISTEIARASMLLYSYYSMRFRNSSYAKTSMDNIVRNLELLDKFIDESAVVRHPDYAILQLPGHHVKWRVDALNKRARSVKECCFQNDYANAYLASNGYLWAACYRNGLVYSEVHYQWDDEREDNDHIASPAFMKQQFTEEEIKAIVNYYITAFPDITLLDALKDGGIVINEDLLGSGAAWLATSDTEIRMYTMSTENNGITWVFLANYWPLKEKLSPEPVSQEPRSDYRIIYTDNYNTGSSQFHNACKAETWFDESLNKNVTRTWHYRFFFSVPSTFYFPDENLLFFSQRSKYDYKTQYED